MGDGKKKKGKKHKQDQPDILMSTPVRGREDTEHRLGSEPTGNLPMGCPVWVTIHAIEWKEGEKPPAVSWGPKAFVFDLDAFAHGRRILIRLDRQPLDMGLIRVWVEDADGRELVYQGQRNDKKDRNYLDRLKRHAKIGRRR